MPTTCVSTYSDFDFTPIQRISLRDLSKVIHKEKVVSNIVKSHSIAQVSGVDLTAEVTKASTFARGPSAGRSSIPASPKE